MTLTAMGRACPSCRTKSRSAECRCSAACGWNQCCAAEADAAYERALSRTRPGATREAIMRQLQDVYLPSGVEIWLHAPNPTLGGKLPIDLLNAGEIEAVAAAVVRLQAGVQS